MRQRGASPLWQDKTVLAIHWAPGGASADTCPHYTHSTISALCLQELNCERKLTGREKWVHFFVQCDVQGPHDFCMDQSHRTHIRTYSCTYVYSFSHKHAESVSSDGINTQPGTSRNPADQDVDDWIKTRALSVRHLQNQVMTLLKVVERLQKECDSSKSGAECLTSLRSSVQAREMPSSPGMRPAAAPSTVSTSDLWCPSSGLYSLRDSLSASDGPLSVDRVASSGAAGSGDMRQGVSDKFEQEGVFRVSAEGRSTRLMDRGKLGPQAEDASNVDTRDLETPQRLSFPLSGKVAMTRQFLPSFNTNVNPVSSALSSSTRPWGILVPQSDSLDTPSVGF